VPGAAAGCDAAGSAAAGVISCILVLTHLTKWCLKCWSHSRCAAGALLLPLLVPCRRRWKFLGHLPLQGSFTLGEVSLLSPVLTADDLAPFAGQLVGGSCCSLIPLPVGLNASLTASCGAVARPCLLRDAS
jgi:hypothetical protein